MAWFHKKLEDMEEAINSGDWKKVSEILDEHRKYPDESVMENELNMAADSIKKYFDSLGTIATFLKSSRLEQGQPIKKNGMEWLQIYLGQAKESVVHFEKEIIRLVKEGKLKE
jgi:hypothetical protein